MMPKSQKLKLEKPEDLAGKKVTVMGLGLLGGGVATVKFLVKNKAIVLVTDLKLKAELAPSLKKLKGLKAQYVLGRHRFEDFRKADLVLQNPGVPVSSPFLKVARQNNIPIENDASLFFLFCKVPIIGITGTKGKSTVSALLAQILKHRKLLLVGHNQVPVLDRLSQIKKRGPIIFELSSWRLEGLLSHKVSPHLAVITNLFPDHLNTYKNFYDYVSAKKIIFKFQSFQDILVLNRDNKETRKLKKEAPSKIYWFSKKYFPEENGTFLKKGIIYFRANKITVPIGEIKEIKLIGSHNLENILAAVTVGKILKVPDKKIKKAIISFNGLKDRLEFIRVYKGIKFYNDTAATNPNATEAALDSFSKKVILIAGGKDKELNYQNLARKIRQKVKGLVLFKGTASEKIKKDLRKFYFKEADNMPAAVKEVKKLALRGDIILLSPGAASFGLFKNEFDRGEQFRKEVKSLK